MSSISHYSALRRIDQNTTASPSWSNVTIAAGRYLVLIGYRAGSARQTTGISHPAIVSATKIRESAVAGSGNRVRISAWDVVSSGGTGTLEITHSGSVWQTLVHGLELVGLSDAVAGADGTAASAASLGLSATASGVTWAAGGAMTEPVDGAATLNASPWNDVSDELTGASGYARQRVVAEAGNQSGQTCTWSMSANNLALAAAVVVLFSDQGGGGGGGAGAALLGAALPGVT